MKALAAARAGKARNPYDQCLPQNAIGIAAAGGFGGGLEFFIAGDHIGAVAENGAYRVIHTGRVDASKLTPGYNGVSVGHWQGDRLVVVTTGYLGDTAGGWPMSDKAKVTDTLWVSADGRTLNIKTIYEDPEYLKEPVARMTYLDRAPGVLRVPGHILRRSPSRARPNTPATFGATPPK